MWIDSHCHLNHEKFQGVSGVSDLVREAVDNYVDGLLTISTRVRGEFPEILDIARMYPNVWCSLGTHPHHAGDSDEKAVTEDDLIRLAQSDPKIIGIGETGLDYHYDFSPPDDQAESFRKHIRACLATGLPMIVHAREADEDIARIIREENPQEKLKAVMHCFSSGRGLAEFALKQGFYISFSGIITFPKADELRDIARMVPLDRLLIETDAPYLAPVPYRGKVNRPAYVAETGRFCAELFGVSPEALARATQENFFCLFDKARLQ